VGTYKKVTNSASTRTGVRKGTSSGLADEVGERSEAGLSLLGRLGLAGRTAFYLILTGLTIRIALLGGPPKHQVNANSAESGLPPDRIFLILAGVRFNP
jgi:hypothetical protein